MQPLIEGTDDAIETYGRRLRENLGFLIRFRGYSIRHVASLAGLGEKTVRNILAGREIGAPSSQSTYPSFVSLVKLALLLGVNPEHLLLSPAALRRMVTGRSRSAAPRLQLRPVRSGLRAPRQGHVRTREGIRIPYKVNGDGAGPRLVFAHGGFGRGDLPLSTIDEVVNAGWTLVTFDQRGHADSRPIASSEAGDRHAMAGDIIAILDDLGWDSAWLGGASMGAATSITAYFDHPERVDGLLQIAPAIDESGVPEVLRTADDQFDAAFVSQDRESLARLLVAATGWDPAPDAAVNLEIDQLNAHDLVSLGRIISNVRTWRVPEVPSRLGEVGVPVAVIGSENDPVHPLERAKAMAAAIPHATLRVIDLQIMNIEPQTWGRVLVEELEAAAAQMLEFGASS